ncbi:DNA adenine methylase [Vreelandella malpeensis]|uniref:DNA adenine methylase n=1 Tax=Vreelandella malpeensis TaxID=1172368 RepID=A0ABS8DUM8_9GAMM|nr:DNA adenine methylase [Halomonas malpeensis]MCB8889956.1 DNA adenine methylase [Halomonas malpeensis]
MSKLPPVLRYHGGKWKMADWLLAHFPNASSYDTYVEPFGGSASVLMRKPRSPYEVYNDMDGEIVNVFRVLQDDVKRERLASLLALTPYARAEFELSYQTSDDPVEQARRTVFRAFSGFGSGAATKGRTGFRGFSGSSGRGVNPANYWARFPDNLAAFGERLSGVVIENRPAVDVMRDRDGARVMHYVDPPYVHGTRALGADGGCYRHEMSDADHEMFLEAIKRLRGFVIVSGYDCDLYRDHLCNWTQVCSEVPASGRGRTVFRTESIWLSSRVAAECQQADMFAGGA